MIDRADRQLVWRRADARCEYCHLRQEHEPFYRLHIEHIVPKKHGGTDAHSNLALACYFCNTHKASNLTGIDPRNGRITRLFHPRKHKWERHFRWQAVLIVGRTAIGRATVKVLDMNLGERVALRLSLLESGDWLY